MDYTVDEAMRYLGCKTTDSDTLRRAEAAVAMLRTRLHPACTWRMLPLTHTEAGEAVGSLLLTGQSAKTMLSGCEAAVLFACTLGEGFDGLMRTCQVRSMAEAVILDACGSAYIEEVCDRLTDKVAAAVPYPYLTDRFSPGYGDLPLAVQQPLLTLLHAAGRTGIHLTSAGLMNPQKSVTAVIGLSYTPKPAVIRGCAYCQMKQQCQLSKGGKRCGNKQP